MDPDKYISGIAFESWLIYLESAPYILLGFLAAALIKSFMPGNIISRHLGKNGTTSVIKASLLGVPLPLCSCAVVPTAMGLKSQGASNGAATAFLISTPETGVDSISVTYALLDPLMTVIRPVSAFLTATMAGLLVNLVPDQNHKSRLTTEASSGLDCGCAGNCRTGPVHPVSEGLVHRIKSGLSFMSNDLIRDIGPWFVLGVVIAGAISFFMPQDYLAKHLGTGIIPLLFMLGLSIPLYVCATASTPIVAALAFKGLSPGAALVFLLAGPATNIITITIVAKVMGIRITMIYLGSIIMATLGLGLAADWIYQLMGYDTADWIIHDPEGEKGLIYLGSALVLALLILYSLRHRLMFWQK
ncbi:SO_0444 family Cu/Zn efflux transporter [Desulfonatronovibrio hydrogenovorans]|uniref:SO_0444 family Cu/Zn efflux transporter n=1 Tax=Desulfonatronovibrio hydrogenovorans TaxID=53245 RepID=UPI000A06AD73|nr:SO_0444 family Cu/Zn efflux transporter [Desulfonatronovibrio hydrogenovorans]